jgi:hypothetical protein
MKIKIKTSKNKFFGLMLMFSAIFLSPFYLFESGLPQPAHILMLIAAVSIVILASSCGSSRKYGCGGGVNKRMTWEKMERRINRP